MVAIAYQNQPSSKIENTGTATGRIEHAPGMALEQFNEMVLAYQDEVYRQAYWIIGDEAAAEDATQEAFLRAYRNLNHFNGGPFRPWIMKIATNYCFDQLRRSKVHKTVPIEVLDENDEEYEATTWLRDPGASVEEIVERADQQARILGAIRRLPADYRAAVILADIQGFDYSEGAQALNIPLGTFKSRLARARVQLQRYLRVEARAPLPRAA